MADDFDIEAYLEAQIDVAKDTKDKNTEFEEKVKNNKRADADNMDTKERKSPPRNDKEDSDSDRERKSKRKKEKKRSSRSRSRSNSRDRYHRSRGSRSDRDRSRSGDRSRRDRSRDRRRDRSRERERDRTGHTRDGRKDRDRSSEKDSKHRATEKEPQSVIAPPAADEAQLAAERELARRKKEIDDLTKDQRTVFVSQLVMKTNEKDIKDFFTQLGKVNDIIMIRDKFTGKHKGFAYVEMAELEAIPNCLLLNGIVPDFQKFPILVKASEAEKNFMAKKDVPPQNISSKQDSNTVIGEIPDSRIYIGNLHVNITEDDLRAVVKQIGPVDTVQIHRDEVGTSKGFAFVRFIRPDDAMAAHTKLAGLELAGKTIKVGFVPDSGNAGNNVASQAASANWKLDDDDGTGMQMNAQSRVMLMAKLGMAAGIQMPNLPPAAASLMVSSAPSHVSGSNSTTKVPPIGGTLSQCFIIKNMFVLEEETDPNWDEDIKEDVLEECSKYGRVEHCYVDNKNTGGLVYLKFETTNAASQAATSLNGRWFAGKMITVSYLSLQEYRRMFNV